MLFGALRKLYAVLMCYSAALLLYDTVLCIEKEVNYVWGSPKTSRRVSRILYMYNRYMSVIWNILTLALISTFSDSVSALHD